MNTQSQQQFARAIQVFTTMPNTETLLLLNKSAIPLIEPTPVPEEIWKSVETSNASANDFSEIRVLVDRQLKEEETSRLSGCLGYALRQSLTGEDLSEPSVFLLSDSPADKRQVTVLEYTYDSTKSRRDDPDYALAFDLAQEYIFAGTPVRSSNRAGAGTKGTRLVEGITPCHLSFFVK